MRYTNGEPIEVLPGLFMHRGAVNCGLLVRDGAALALDVCDSLKGNELRDYGIERVELVLLTQYRRNHSSGAAALAAMGAEIVAPESERAYVEDPDFYWQDEKNRWGLIDYRPYHMAPVVGAHVSRGVRGGDRIVWRGVRIDVVDAPGSTDGSVAYLFDWAGERVAFAGDSASFPELYSLQVKDAVSCGYHGFFGARESVYGSAKRILDAGASLLIPSHGLPVRGLSRGTSKALFLSRLRHRIDALMENYLSVSAMGHYFPEAFGPKADPRYARRMKPSIKTALPKHVLRCGDVAFLLVSESGAAIMVDCFRGENVRIAKGFLESGAIRSIDALFITHYHYDHIEAASELSAAFGCPIWTTDAQLDLLRYPIKYFLPCIANAPLDAVSLPHGKPFSWNGFELTAYDFPGQTLYGSALLARGRGDSILFVGDSLSPTGLDDYCAGNRNFLREGTGLLSCLDIVESLPDVSLLNQHQDFTFRFDPARLAYLREVIRLRRQLINTMIPYVPSPADIDGTEEDTASPDGAPKAGVYADRDLEALWPHYECATDEWWLRTYPFEQAVCGGGVATVELLITNHSSRSIEVLAEPRLPEGFPRVSERGAIVPPETSGHRHGAEPDGSIRFAIPLPEGADRRYVVPFRIAVDGRYYGQFRVAILDARPRNDAERGAGAV